jgi:hypothetical protein
MPAELRIAWPAPLELPDEELLVLELPVRAESRELRLPLEDVALVVMVIVSVESGHARCGRWRRVAGKGLVWHKGFAGGSGPDGSAGVPHCHPSQSQLNAARGG